MAAVSSRGTLTGSVTIKTARKTVSSRKSPAPSQVTLWAMGEVADHRVSGLVHGERAGHSYPHLRAPEPGDLGLAEDSVQEACLAAVQEWDGGHLPRNPQAWLTGVARHKAMLRRLGRAEDAKRAYRTALELEPPESERRFIASRLGGL